MIFQIIIGIGIVLSMLIFSTQFLPNIVSDAINVFIEPFYVMIDKTFVYLAFMLPIICAVIPIYMLRNRDERILVIGAFYGLALMFITIALGLDSNIIDYFRTSWFTSWTSMLGTFKDVFYLIFYWMWGIFLYIIDLFITGIIKAYKPALKAKRKITKWKKDWKSKKKRS